MNTRCIFLFTALREFNTSVISKLRHTPPPPPHSSGFTPHSTSVRAQKRRKRKKKRKEIEETLFHNCAIKLVIHLKLLIKMYISLASQPCDILISLLILSMVQCKLFYGLICSVVLDNRGFCSNDNSDGFAVYADPQGVFGVSSLV